MDTNYQQREVKEEEKPFFECTFLQRFLAFSRSFGDFLRPVLSDPKLAGI